MQMVRSFTLFRLSEVAYYYVSDIATYPPLPTLILVSCARYASLPAVLWKPQAIVLSASPSFSFGTCKSQAEWVQADGCIHEAHVRADEISRESGIEVTVELLGTASAMLVPPT